MTATAPTSTTKICYDSSGHRLKLGSQIGRGGEGSVYAISGRPESVAKIFHNPLPDEQARKLGAMVPLSTDRLRSVAAWPSDVLRSSKSGPVIGITMPNVGDRQPIHQLYGAKSRLQQFPESDWRFLIKAAENTAITFHTVHTHGHVIGDVNEQNLLVASNATVVLIDVDSFQISTGIQTYFCDVGVPTFTPPELQGKALRGLTRTSNHDRFGLAVMIFLLLCMGRHPFAGRYLDSGEMPIEQAIQDFRYAYSKSAESHRMAPPPGTLPVQNLPTEIQELFESSFRKSGVARDGRPSAKEWIEALRKMNAATVRCTNVKSHYFIRPPSLTCPWCSLKNRNGVDYFPPPPPVQPPPPPPPPVFDLAEAWKNIEAVKRPDSVHGIPGSTTTKPQPHPEALEASDRWRIRQTEERKNALKWFGIGLVLAFPTYALYEWGGITLLCIIGYLAYITVRKVKYDDDDSEALRTIYQNKLKSAENAYARITGQWNSLARSEPFQEMLEELKRQKEEYQKIPKLKKDRYEKLKSRIRVDQYGQYLRQNKLTPGMIRGIGDSRIATLRSHGIESAYDISDEAIRGINGFGDTLVNSLLEWRKQVERRFPSVPTRPFTPAERESVEREFRTREQNIKEKLIDGPQRLEKVRNEIETSRTNVKPKLVEAKRDLAQARANFEAF